jgi:uncharacterized Zn finger protein
VTDALDEDDSVDVAECGRCGQLTEHNVLRRQAKGEGEDVLVQCVDCQEVQTLHLRPGKAVSITSILSDGADSRTDYVEADDDEKISVGDVFEHDEILYKITRLDDSESRPKKIIDARDISTLWAVRCDKAVVRLTMTDGEESRSKTIECSPEDVFSCGSIMEVDGERWRIRALHTGQGRTLRGKRSAMDIKRVYLHPPYGRVRGEDRRDTRDYRDDRRDDYRRDTRQR